MNFARMILSGLGCRLQTCSCLATEWFNSTFRATSFLFYISIGLDIRAGCWWERPSGQRLITSLRSSASQLNLRHAGLFSHGYTYTGSIKDDLKDDENHPGSLPFPCLFSHSVTCPLMYLITHGLIHRSNSHSFIQSFNHSTKYLFRARRWEHSVDRSPRPGLMVLPVQGRRQTLNNH